MADPILAAGFRFCTPCHAEAWPVDAAWLGADLILVSYPAVCRHIAAQAMVITVSAMVVTQPRCAGITAAGTRCRSKPTGGAEFCWQHHPGRHLDRRVRPDGA